MFVALTERECTTQVMVYGSIKAQPFQGCGSQARYYHCCSIWNKMNQHCISINIAISANVWWCATLYTNQYVYFILSCSFLVGSTSRPTCVPHHYLKLRPYRSVTCGVWVEATARRRGTSLASRSKLVVSSSISQNSVVSKSSARAWLRRNSSLSLDSKCSKHCNRKALMSPNIAEIIWRLQSNNTRWRMLTQTA